MKAPFSTYLTRQAEPLKKLIRLLSEDFDYVSVLATDSPGFAISLSPHTKSIATETIMTERGNVVRVRKDGLYSEYAFQLPSGTKEAGDSLSSDASSSSGEGADPTALAATLREALNRQLAVLKATRTQVYETEILPDEPAELFAEMESALLPEEAPMDKIVAMLQKACDSGMALSKEVIDCRIRAQSTHVNKMFLSVHRDLRQSYVYSEISVLPIVSRNGRTEMAFRGLSDRRGPELFDEIPGKIKEYVEDTLKMLDASRVVPGEYDIITTPEVSGLIAHEAFGHGVEMDMFVKDRALGASYIGERVGSDLVTMHEGALCTTDVASYAFDDEGTLAGDVTEIDHGILKTGICDALSALRLQSVPTGNGKRENFEHKVYTRMTNTLFDSGTSSLEEMIASVQYGYLLQGMQSGMEDPKHWGIQCIVERGLEIKDGKLTGKIVTPVVMTGYVPDLLGSVSMVSTDRESFGTGYCGKGYKEFVKVSDGGPYLKARAVLG